MGNKAEKTNVTRILDAKKIKYEFFLLYEDSDTAKSVEEIAVALNRQQECVFKTLVTVGKSGVHYVFMLPGGSELDLKKAAKVTGEKSVEMIPQKDLLPLTGYVHGGCSPIGMKIAKQFNTYIDSSAENCEKIYFSAGKIGRQVCMTLGELQKVVKVTPVDLKKEN